MCINSMPWSMGAGGAKGLEAEHRSNDPFDGAVILLDQVV